LGGIEKSKEPLARAHDAAAEPDRRDRTVLDSRGDRAGINANPARKKRTVNAPTGSQIRAQRPEIATWTGSELHAFLTWNRDVLEDDLFPLWRTIAFTEMRPQ
jgi:hypothetical protein